MISHLVPIIDNHINLVLLVQSIVNTLIDDAPSSESCDPTVAVVPSNVGIVLITTTTNMYI